MHIRIKLSLLVVCLILAEAVGAAELFPLSDVRVLAGPFKHAQDVNAQTLLKYEPDRLLAPYLIEAGLKPKAKVYPNWEHDGLGGHTAGHYLSALANHYAATGDPRFNRRLAYMVNELARCQKALGTGYVGGIPNHAELWAQLKQGDIRAGSFHLNDKWVPWYNLHKTFAGLRDAYVVANNAQAKDVLVKLADWCMGLARHLNDEQMQRMLITEFGGMNEVLADVAQITGDDQYLDLATRFNHHWLLAPLAQEQDRLDGMHANTQVPKVIGFEQIAQMTGDDSLHTAALFFWETVTQNRTLAFGGNSDNEYFPSSQRAKDLLTSRTGPETCNTYNMLRLSELLFERRPEPRFADFYERALYNHILSSQHPEHGGYVYFTPVRARHYRVYSQPETCFWCCVGSGMENHTKYGQFIYAHDENALFVNLFIESELHWKDKDVKVKQTTAFPQEQATTLTIETDQPTTFTLHIRHPQWVEDQRLQVSLNGKQLPEASASEPSSYFPVRREWKSGDTVTVTLPMHVTTEAMPDVPNQLAILYGPLVLAGDAGTDDLAGLIANEDRMAHIAHGPLHPLNEAPMLVADPDDVAENVKQQGDKLRFTIENIIRPNGAADIELRPFYQVHDTRYILYWQTLNEQAYEQQLAAIKAEEAKRLALEKLTIDRVAPGEQQPEADHNFRGQRTSAGTWQDRKYRHAAGWFSYDLKTKGNKGLTLRVDYFGSDHRDFDILIDDKLLQSVSLKGEKPGAFFSADYPIDNDLVAAAKKGILTVRFQAKPGSMAGGIFDVRLMQFGDE